MIPGVSSIQTVIITLSIIAVVIGVEEYRINTWKTSTYKAQKLYAEIESVNEKLYSKLKLQNQKVANLVKAAKTLSTKSDLAAIKALQIIERNKTKIQTSDSGPVEMNRWFRALY